MERKSVLWGAERKPVIPFSLWCMRKTLFNPGLRMSSPTMMTFLPNNARLTARLDAMNVFPSPLMVEVTRITFLSGSPNMKSRLVRQAAEGLCHDVVVVFADSDGMLFVGVVQGNIADNRNTRKSFDIRMSFDAVAEPGSVYR